MKQLEALEVNENETRAKARKILSSYRYYLRVASKEMDYLFALRSNELRDGPIYHSNRNSYEDAFINMLSKVDNRKREALEFIAEIDEAIEMLPSLSSKILTYAYCQKEKNTMNDIAAKIIVSKRDSHGQEVKVQYSVKNIERVKAIALLEFAEIYREGALLVWK